MKHLVWRPFSFFKTRQITIRLTLLAIHHFANLMNLAATFEVLEHLNDFDIIGDIILHVFFFDRIYAS